MDMMHVEVERTITVRELDHGYDACGSPKNNNCKGVRPWI